MIYLDSWIWIEFFAEDERWKEAEAAIEEMKEMGGISSTIALLEVRYRIESRFNRKTADYISRLIEDFDELKVLPVTSEVAHKAADLRSKHYNSQKRERSYADAIHLATALKSGCDMFYTGDPGFKEVEEIEPRIIGS